MWLIKRPNELNKTMRVLPGWIYIEQVQNAFKIYFHGKHVQEMAPTKTKQT